MIIVFLGAPGAGKGSIADWLIKNQNYQSISTGDVIRQEIAQQTKIGKKVSAVVNTGQLVKDSIINKIIKKYFKEHKNDKNLILDGYPRTYKQAKFLDKLTNINCVLKFDIAKQSLLKRITGRYQCPKCKANYNINSEKKELIPTKKNSHYFCTKCSTQLTQRRDDTPTVFKTRYEAYEKIIVELEPYYQKKGILQRFNADCDYDQFIQCGLKALKIK